MRPVDRSMNLSLTEGMVDGKIKRPNPNRGGMIEPTSTLHRTSLNSDYGFYECEMVDDSDERPDVVGMLP